VLVLMPLDRRVVVEPLILARCGILHAIT